MMGKRRGKKRGVASVSGRLVAALYHGWWANRATPWSGRMGLLIRIAGPGAALLQVQMHAARRLSVREMGRAQRSKRAAMGSVVLMMMTAESVEERGAVY